MTCEEEICGRMSFKLVLKDSRYLISGDLGIRSKERHAEEKRRRLDWGTPRNLVRHSTN